MSCPFEVLFNPEFAEKKQRKCLKRGWKGDGKRMERGENGSI
jgi:hypothetical protein